MKMPRTDLKALPPEDAGRFFRRNGFAVSINQHALLSPPDVSGLVASVLAVVEREAGNKAARDVTFCNLLDARKPWRAAARDTTFNNILGIRKRDSLPAVLAS